MFTYLTKSSDLRWDEYPALYLLASTKYDINRAEQYLNELGILYNLCNIGLELMVYDLKNKLYVSFRMLNSTVIMEFGRPSNILYGLLTIWQEF